MIIINLTRKTTKRYVQGKKQKQKLIMTHNYCRRYAATAIIIINRMSAVGVVFVINS